MVMIIVPIPNKLLSLSTHDVERTYSLSLLFYFLIILYEKVGTTLWGGRGNVRVHVWNLPVLKAEKKRKERKKRKRKQLEECDNGTHTPTHPHPIEARPKA